MKKIVVLLIGIFFITNVFAQKKIAPNNTLNFKNGQLLAIDANTGNLKLASSAYDPLIVGVFQASEKISISQDDSIYVVKSPIIKKQGLALVRYNHNNGVIKKGDLLTASDVPGEVMKATKSGVILGIALEDTYKPEGFVKVRILIQYVR